MKRLLSLVMVLILCISLMPLTVLADEVETVPAEENIKETRIDEQSETPAEQSSGTTTANEAQQTEVLVSDESADAILEPMSENEEENIENSTQAIAVEEVNLQDMIVQAGGLENVDAECLEGAMNTTAYQTILDGLNAKSETISLEGMNVGADEIRNLYSIVLNKNPRLFFVAGSFEDTRYGNVVVTLRPQYSTLFTDDMISAFDSAVNNILSQVQSSWSDIEKAVFLHDYLVLHCTYDQSDANTCYTAYGCLVLNKAVCQGYALAYMYLLKACGVEADVICSYDLNHAWNTVTLNSKKYFVDVTWDDPLGYYDAYCGYEYFLCSMSTLSEDHNSTDWVDTDGNSVMSLNNTEYDSAFWHSTEDCFVGAFAYYNSKWYGMQNGNQLCTVDFQTNTVATASSVDSLVWYAWGSKTRYYAIGFSTLAVYNNTLYLSGPDALYAMTQGGAFEKAYTLSETESALGYIYGIMSTENGVQYAIQESYLKSSWKQNGYFKGGTVTSGTCGAEGNGSNLTWKIEGVGILTISGTGAMKDYSGSDVPWRTYQDKITTIVIDDGVTSIGAAAFSSCGNLTAVCYAGKESQWSSITIGTNNNSLTNAKKYFEYTAGDVTGGGSVDIMDVLRLLKHVAGQTVNMAYPGDVTGDGTVNIMDVLRLLKYVAGQNVEIY